MRTSGVFAARCALLGGLWLAAAAPGGPAAPAPPDSLAPPRTIGFSGRTMGTYDRIVLVAAESTAVAPLAARGQAEFQRVDSLMSNWTTTSEVARINREAGAGPTRMQREVAIVVDTALSVWRGSHHTMDITVEPLVRAWGFLGGTPHVPSEDQVREAFRHVGADKLEFDRHAGTLRFKDPLTRIDLGGIAKGYAVDAVVGVLRALGVKDALVDLSGNMFALGRPPGSERWRIGMRDPRDRMPYFARLTLSGEGIATAAAYEQFVAANGRSYGHILDPRIGRPAEGLLAATVVAPSAFMADAWDTGLFALGPVDARRTAREQTGFAAVLVQPGSNGVDTVWVESPLRDRFKLEPGAAGLFVVRYF